jgi:hypothetical protein
MKNLLTSLIAVLSLTTTPAYAESDVVKAITLGRYRGELYCLILSYGVRTQDEMLDVLMELNDPKVREAWALRDHWRDTGNTAMQNIYIKAIADYTNQNCPLEMRQYLNDN